MSLACIWSHRPLAGAGRSVTGRGCGVLYSHSSCQLSFFFQAEDGIRDLTVTGVQTCALPISTAVPWARDAPARFLTWNEVAELQAAGHDIGSHTMSHLLLADAPDGEVERQLS